MNFDGKFLRTAKTHLYKKSLKAILPSSEQLKKGKILPLLCCLMFASIEIDTKNPNNED
jgi:hypothetical protein